MDGNLRPVLSTYGQFADWTAALASHGFTAREVAQMAGENMARVIGQVIG
jgi:microsomal dipeptidase-like Zn-dependent dipeptidase